MEKIHKIQSFALLLMYLAVGCLIIEIAGKTLLSDKHKMIVIIFALILALTGAIIFIFYGGSGRWQADRRLRKFKKNYTERQLYIKLRTQRISK